MRVGFARESSASVRTDAYRPGRIGATDKLVGELIAFCEHRCERLSPPLRVASWARPSGFPSPTSLGNAAERGALIAYIFKMKVTILRWEEGGRDGFSQRCIYTRAVARADRRFFN